MGGLVAWRSSIMQPRSPTALGAAAGKTGWAGLVGDAPGASWLFFFFLLSQVPAETRVLADPLEVSPPVSSRCSCASGRCRDSTGAPNASAANERPRRWQGAAKRLFSFWERNFNGRFTGKERNPQAEITQVFVVSAYISLYVSTTTLKTFILSRNQPWARLNVKTFRIYIYFWSMKPLKFSIKPLETLFRAALNESSAISFFVWRICNIY